MGMLFSTYFLLNKSIRKQFKKYFIYLFLKRGKGRWKEGEKHQLVASHSCLDWD